MERGGARRTYRQRTELGERCSKLVNPKTIHGDLRSFLDLPRISGRILTSQGFQPYFDMYKDTPAICWLARTSPPFVDISREYPMCSALSHTQESTRRFIEVTWVPLHQGFEGPRGAEHPLGVGVFCAGTPPLGVAAQENTRAGGGLCTEHPRWGCLRRRTPPQGVVSAQDHPAGGVQLENKKRGGFLPRENGCRKEEEAGRATEREESNITLIGKHDPTGSDGSRNIDTLSNEKVSPIPDDGPQHTGGLVELPGTIVTLKKDYPNGPCGHRLVDCALGSENIYGVDPKYDRGDFDLGPPEPSGEQAAPQLPLLRWLRRVDIGGRGVGPGGAHVEAKVEDVASAAAAGGLQCRESPAAAEELMKREASSAAEGRRVGVS
ncbi:hypothetical protein Taro_020062 [Colocasia esculenta]|uniref:Uncharacterized protein n=1 Tax=Colocasia esculenta TaxID=4460 RepID=A0A843UVF1_COLES|nr:hypothetical protein [Colocasia esculenta]